MTKEQEEKMSEQIIQLGMEISRLQGENEILKQQNTEFLKLLKLNEIDTTGNTINALVKVLKVEKSVDNWNSTLRDLTLKKLEGYISKIK